jgi:hypothetical protein
MSGANALIANNYGRWGAVYGFEDSSFEMRGSSAKITGNYAWNAGGGVQVVGTNSVFVMSGDSAEISNNYAGNAGGGVYVGAGGATFTMSGAHAKITGNTAPYWYGGGVCVRSSFFMEAGEITGNTASQYPPPASRPGDSWQAPKHDNLTVREGSTARFTGRAAWIGNEPVSIGDMFPSLIQEGRNQYVPLYGPGGGAAVRAEK